VTEVVEDSVHLVALGHVRRDISYLASHQDQPSHGNIATPDTALTFALPSAALASSRHEEAPEFVRRLFVLRRFVASLVRGGPPSEGCEAESADTEKDEGRRRRHLVDRVALRPHADKLLLDGDVFPRPA